jgi:hypothetical protein
MSITPTFIKPGELRYKGRRVNPETFKTKGKDLRRLVGRCQSCGCILRGAAAIPTHDSYEGEINDNYTPVVQCTDCNDSSAEDI